MYGLGFKVSSLGFGANCASGLARLRGRVWALGILSP